MEKPGHFGIAHASWNHGNDKHICLPILLFIFFNWSAVLLFLVIYTFWHATYLDNQNFMIVLSAHTQPILFCCFRISYIFLRFSLLSGLARNKIYTASWHGCMFFWCFFFFFFSVSIFKRRCLLLSYNF